MPQVSISEATLREFQKRQGKQSTAEVEKPPKAPRKPTAPRPPKEGVEHPPLTGQAVRGVVGGVRCWWRRCEGKEWDCWMNVCETMTVHKPVDGEGVDCPECDRRMEVQGD